MASKMKIKVIDESEGVKLNLPGIPFWLINASLSLALKFKPLILKNLDDSDEDTKAVFEALEDGMIQDLINELKRNGEFDLVDISTGDGTLVKISIT